MAISLEKCFTTLAPNRLSMTTGQVYSTYAFGIFFVTSLSVIDVFGPLISGVYESVFEFL